MNLDEYLKKEFEEYLKEEYEVELLYQRCEPMFSNTLEEYNCESCLENECEHWKRFNDEDEE